jgi:hypothetical protein
MSEANLRIKAIHRGVGSLEYLRETESDHDQSIPDSRVHLKNTMERNP